jgi:mono/diheme cytochrome c family protein
VPGDQVKDFGTLYATRCAGCHGADGKLGPAPPLNDPLFLAIVPDAELMRVIGDGRSVSATQKTPMPAFLLGKNASLTEEQAKVWAELKNERHANPKQQGVLTEAQVKVLAEGIKKRWGPTAQPRGSVPPYLAPMAAGERKDSAAPRPPVGSEPERAPPPRSEPGNPPAKPGDVTNDGGASVFARACAGCHGNQGQGGKYGDRQVGAINDPAFLAFISDQALRRYVITGRPDLGMPAFDGKDGRPPDFRPLTSSEIQSVVALLAQWRSAGPANRK